MSASAIRLKAVCDGPPSPQVASADHVQGLPTKKERRAEQRAAEDKGEADDASTIAAGGVESAAAEGEEAKSAPPLAAAPVPGKGPCLSPSPSSPVPFSQALSFPPLASIKHLLHF